jgi:hypothetical protein
VNRAGRAGTGTTSYGSKAAQKGKK